MSFHRFLDVAHAILVEEYVRLGKDLLGALQERSQWAAGGERTPPVESTPTAGGKRAGTSAARRNTQALEELQRMMRGTGFKGAKA